MESQPHNVIEIFCSYSHKDEALRRELEKHLKILERRGIVAVWNDRKIAPGDDWKGQLDGRLETADIILLLISPDFIASNYCYEIEMTRALARHDAGEARVIPVFLRPANWNEAPFDRLQGLPAEAKPVTKWGNRDEAFLNVSKGIQLVVEALLAGRKTNAGTQTAGAKSASSSQRIPRPPNVGFVPRRDAQGRDIVAFLREELAPGKIRLITLSAPGGMGKTTLAAEAARELVKHYGEHFVWSDAVRSGYTLSTLLDDIATQLGRAELRQLAPEAKAAAARELVGGSPSLVVLDNCETIEPAERTLVERWFTGAQCSALFTSREMIKGTRNVAIPAMPRDEAEQLLENLMAQTPDPQTFSTEVRQRIYETAEANPYLIEWVTLQIAEAREPQTVFDELARGEGDAAQRVFTRSFNLPQVGDDGRAALLALSLFARSAMRPALAEVAGFGDDQKRLDNAVRGLYALGLVKTLEQHSRFTIEGLTRSLAATYLSKDDRAAEFRRRFVAYFMEYAEAHAQTTPEDFDALEAERENLLAAIDISFETKQWGEVMAPQDTLWNFLLVRGYWDEAVRRGQQAVEAAQAAKNKRNVAVFSGNVATIRQIRGEYREAKEAHTQAVVAFKELGDDENVAVGLHQLGIIAQEQGENDEARRLYSESLEINRRLGNQSGVALTLYELGRLAHTQGSADEARHLFSESLEIREQTSDQMGIAATLHALGCLAHTQGSVDEARKLFGRSMEIKKGLADQIGIAATLHQLGRLAQEEGDLNEARCLYEESLEIMRRLGDQKGIAISLGQLGVLATQQGDKGAAVRLYREALSIFEKLGSPYVAVTRRNLEMLEGDES